MINSPILFGKFGGIVTTSLSAVSTMRVDATGEKIAFRYIPQITSPIESVNIRLGVTGTTAKVRVGVFASAGGYPDNSTQLGGYSTEITPSTGWTGLQALSSNTGDLTVGNNYWIVLDNDTGTVSDTNYFEFQKLQTASSTAQTVCRVYTSSSWTGSAIQPAEVLAIVKHVNGQYFGLHSTAAWNRSTAATDIYGANFQGLKCRVGSKSTVLGAWVYLNKAGTPNDLVLTLYEGTTSRATKTLAQADIATGSWNLLLLTTPYEIPADTDHYLIFSQSGISDSNDYDIYTLLTDSTYISAMMSSNYRFVCGTDIASLTTLYEVPAIVPVYASMESSFDCAAGGGGGRPEFRGGNL
jgi:hypothetical protein